MEAELGVLLFKGGGLVVRNRKGYYESGVVNKWKAANANPQKLLSRNVAEYATVSNPQEYQYLGVKRGISARLMGKMVLF